MKKLLFLITILCTSCTKQMDYQSNLSKIPILAFTECSKLCLDANSHLTAIKPFQKSGFLISPSQNKSWCTLYVNCVCELKNKVLFEIQYKEFMSTVISYQDANQQKTCERLSE